MPHFLEGSYDGVAVSNARVNSSCLGFCGGSDYFLERLANDNGGTVDAVRVINKSKVVMYDNAAARFGLHKVSGVRTDLEDYVSGVEANCGVGVCAEVFHEPVGLFHGVCGSFGLIESYFVESDEDAGVNSAVEDEGDINRLDVGDTFWV